MTKHVTGAFKCNLQFLSPNHRSSSPIPPTLQNSMSSPRAPGNDGDKNRDAAVAKTAGFVVFSGIAMSILKAINPLNKNKCEATPQPLREPPPPEPILKVLHVLDIFFSISVL